MGEVVALRSDLMMIYHTARRTAWRSLTKVEQTYVHVVENNKNLFELFDSLEMGHLMGHPFIVPSECSAFEQDALMAMHRFVDELSYLMAELRDVKEFVDDLNYGSARMPAR